MPCSLFFVRSLRKKLERDRGEGVVSPFLPPFPLSPFFSLLSSMFSALFSLLFRFHFSLFSTLSSLSYLYEGSWSVIEKRESSVFFYPYSLSLLVSLYFVLIVYSLFSLLSLLSAMSFQFFAISSQFSSLPRISTKEAGKREREGINSSFSTPFLPTPCPFQQ